MPSTSKLVLGMMSGTSVDGIDVSLVRISGAPPYLKIKLLNHTNRSFPGRHPQRNPPRRRTKPGLVRANSANSTPVLGHIYAEAALAACKKFRISPRKIDLTRQPRPNHFSSGRARSLSRRTHLFHAPNRRRRYHRQPHRNHHRFRLPPCRLRPRRQRRPACPLRRLRPLPRTRN